MTFDARGTIRSEGDFRQWTNGNLQALLEPTDAGHRLRLKTVKGQAIPYMGLGSVLLGAAAVTGIGAFLAGAPVLDPDTILLAGVGAGAGTVYSATRGTSVKVPSETLLTFVTRQ